MFQSSLSTAYSHYPSAILSLMLTDQRQDILHGECLLAFDNKNDLYHILTN